MGRVMPLMAWSWLTPNALKDVSSTYLNHSDRVSVHPSLFHEVVNRFCEGSARDIVERDIDVVAISARSHQHHG